MFYNINSRRLPCFLKIERQTEKWSPIVFSFSVSRRTKHTFKTNARASNISHCKSQQQCLSSTLFLKKVGHFRPLSLFFVVSIKLTIQMFYLKNCRWLESNHGLLVSDAATLPTETQPLQQSLTFNVSIGLWFGRPQNNFLLERRLLKLRERIIKCSHHEKTLGPFD